jgi:MFS family permease
VAFLSNAVMYAAIIYIPYFVQGILGRSATASGAVTVPMTIAVMVTSNIVGIFATEKSTLFKYLTILAFVLAAAGMFLLSLMTSATGSLTVIVYMVILGAGIGFTMPISNTTCKTPPRSSSWPRRRGR